MSDERFANCPKHGVRRCLVCNPPKGRIVNTARPGEKPAAPITEADIPEVPNFDFEHPMNSESEYKIMDMDGVFAPDPPFQIPDRGTKDPLVSAAEDYSKACRVHMDAQAQVARAREMVEAAKKQEEETYKQRVDAQTKLAEMVAKTTEAVL